MEGLNHTLGDYWQLLQRCNLLASDQPLDTQTLAKPITQLTYQSQDVREGCLFVVKGLHFKGEYLTQAVGRGGVAYVAERPWKEGSTLPCLLVKDIRKAMGYLANYFYQNPSRKLHMIGVTGTKGKSSTTYYLKHIFDDYMETIKQPESGVISSIDTYDGVERFESHLTTPEAMELQRHLAHGVSTGMRYLTAEVSSQALKYDRMLGVELAAAVFLNIGYDHISPLEHSDFEDYVASKLKIFEYAPLAIVNADMDQAERVLKAAEPSQRVISFSQKDPRAIIYGSEVRKEGDCIYFRVKSPRFHREFCLTMPGLFNVENALAAIAVCEGLNIPEESVYRGLKYARVPGRMEVYTNANRQITAIVDYAHNTLSFEKLFQSTQAEYPNQPIVIVYGCPGKKALDRRKDLSEISDHYAQRIIITEEDAGEESILDISREMAQYIQKADYSIVPNRGQAIRMAVMECNEPTVLLLTGKGAETRQKRGRAYVDCPSDVEYVQKYLEEYDIMHHLDGTSKIMGLIETLPALGPLKGKRLVVSYQGDMEEGRQSFLQDLLVLQQIGAEVLVVHDGKDVSCQGEPQEEHHEEARLPSVLLGEVNPRWVDDFIQQGGKAFGLSAKACGVCKEAQTPSSFHNTLLSSLWEQGYLPIVAPVIEGYTPPHLLASTLAQGIEAFGLVMITNQKTEKFPIGEVSLWEAKERKEPLFQAAIKALEQGVSYATILHVSQSHGILVNSVWGHKMGTTIVGDR